MTSLDFALIYLLAAVLGVVLFRSLKLPSMLGYLIVGVIVGPHVLGMIHTSANVRWLAELGVVFLMFVIGLEFNLPRLRAMRRRLGGVIYQRYGFVDAFNTSFRVADAKLSDGRYLPGFGWVDTDVIGIDQGSTLAMLANHRSGSVWATMRRQPDLRRGLQRPGFRGGWLG